MTAAAVLDRVVVVVAEVEVVVSVVQVFEVLLVVFVDVDVDVVVIVIVLSLYHRHPLKTSHREESVQQHFLCSHEQQLALRCR